MTAEVDIAQLYADAVRSHKSGDIETALQAYRDLLLLCPDHADAHHMLGVIALQSGRTGQAVDLLRRAVSLAPNSAPFRNNCGAALRACGKNEEAVEMFRRAAALDPASSDAATNLGNALLDAGDAEGASSAYRRALSITPDNASSRNGLAACLRHAGDLRGAKAQYEKLVSADPSNVVALNNLGVVQMELGETEAAYHSYESALENDPNNTETLNNISILLLGEGESSKAEALLRSALEIAPESAAGWGNLGNILRRQSRVEEAAACYRRALAIDPSDGLRIRLGTLLPVIPESPGAMTEARDRMEQAIDDLLATPIAISDPMAEVGATNFHLSYHATNNRRLNEKIARLYRQACPSLGYVAPHCRTVHPHEGRRLKVGFLSKHLRDHAVGWCYSKIIRNLPAERFEVFAFSNACETDPVWRSIAGTAAKAIDLPASLPAAREAVAGEELDVLIYTDIGMDPMTYFLSFSRLAPVQCVTNGHPDTTGVPELDYFLSSAPLEEEGAQSHYSETLVAMEGVLVDYERPELPAVVPDRAAFGLPVDATLYLCPQSLFKFHPMMDKILAGILREDRNGRLVVFSGPEENWWRILSERWRVECKENFARIQRVERQSFSNFLAMLRHADVVLDTWPFCGGNTAYQTFAMGRPIVTLPGEFARGRSTFALYQRMGIPDLIAGSPDEYAELAVRLGTDTTWRQGLVEKIEARADLLFGDCGAADAFARFLDTVGSGTVAA